MALYVRNRVNHGEIMVKLRAICYLTENIEGEDLNDRTTKK